MQRTLDTAVNATVLLAALVFLFRPDGALTGPLTDWYAAKRAQTHLQEKWPQLVDGAGLLGDSMHPVAVVEFMDYQCPYCRRMHRLKEQHQLNREFSTAVRHLPLSSIHPNAELAARISICGQASAASWPRLHALLYLLADSLHEIDWEARLADWQVPNDVTLASCVVASETTERLRWDGQLAYELAITGTPTYAFRSQLRRGALPLDEFRKSVAASVDRAEEAR